MRIGLAGGVLWSLLTLSIARAGDQGVDQGLLTPVRLTAGASNQMMGVLSADGGALYFVSDKDATAELFIQRPVDSGSRLLFETNADVAWPSPAPDGRSLAYISYQQDATGDACLLDLDTLQSRCLTGLDSAELQVLWLTPHRLGVLSRPGLHADYQLLSFDVRADRPRAEVLMKENMLGPAVSPNGRWLAMVPVVRSQQGVGVGFANRAGDGISIIDLDTKRRSVHFKPDLPGTVGFGSFGRDGRYLYFSQYLNDTNQDGRIDGNDHSVLFRVGLDASQGRPLANAWPEQLTSAQWNCRYPAPARDRLIATCSRAGSLDIYSLPLSGAVPGGWSLDRLRQEVTAARDHWTQLLLLARLLTRETRTGARLEVLRQMAVLHLELSEYASAAFYGQQISRLSGGEHATYGTFAALLAELIEHRRQDLALAQGQPSETYLKTEQERLRRLAERADAGDPDQKALLHLVMAEIQDHLGQKEQARATFEQIDLAPLKDPLLLRLLAPIGQELYALWAEREPAVALLRQLSLHPALAPEERLHFAEALIHELLRGLPRAEHPAVIQAFREQLPPGSEPGLLFEVMGHLLRLTSDNQEQVRQDLFELYKANKQVARRKALVLVTIRTAMRLGNAYLPYQFTTSWASWLKKNQAERKYAEQLYQAVVLERAYTELARNKLSEARGYFYGTTLQTESLEAQIGFIETRIKEGRRPQDDYARRCQADPEQPACLFAAAYLDARSLAAVSDPKRFDEILARAWQQLEPVLQKRPRSMEARQLAGYLLHQRYLRSGDPAFAVSALRHYLLALDLAAANPRYRAALLQQIGLLQAALGNHRQALGYFLQREQLPSPRPRARLDLLLAMARSLFHIDAPAEAVARAEQALEVAGSTPELKVFLPLVEDRLALYLHAAGQHARASALYEQLIAFVDQRADGEMAQPVNRLKLRLSAASALLADRKYDRAIARLRQAEAILQAGDALRTRDFFLNRCVLDEHRPDREAYALLLAGLLAQAARGQGDFALANQALKRRQELLQKRLLAHDRDDDLLELARTAAQLGELAYRQGALDTARKHLEEGLAFIDRFKKRTNTPSHVAELRLVQALCEVHLYGRLALTHFGLDLKQRLQQVYDALCEHPSPSRQGERFLLGTYLAWFELNG